MRYLFLVLICSASFSLFSQVSDDFSDGNLTDNPTWDGDAMNFEVDADNKLHLIAPSFDDISILYTESSEVNDVTWEFDVEMDFNPSSTSLTKAYLMSNESNFNAGLQGYYVMIGDSEDEVSLYRQDGLNDVKIIDGVDDFIDVSSVEITVRVTRSAAGDWELYRKEIGQTGFISEGTTNDQTYDVSSYFGFSCKYIASRSDKFYFDNIEVGADNTAPSLSDILVVNSNTISLVFSEAMNETTIQELSNFSVNNGIGIPTTADVMNSQTVNLSFATDFDSGVENTISITNLEDLAGNMLNTDAFFTYIFVATAEEGDVIFNEIMADPTGDIPNAGIPDVEYVELYNTSDNSFDLAGWNFVNTNTSKTLSQYILQPDAYVILCDEDDVSLLQSYGDCIGISSFTALSNGGDSLTLLTNQGLISDAVDYDESWYNVDPVPGGFSFELINPFHPCSFQSNWTISLSSEGGTPGAQNSVFDDAPDVTSPSIQSFSVNSNLQMEVVFNELITTESVEDINLTIEPSLAVTSVSVAGLSSISIVFTEGIVENTLYTMNIEGLADCSGNVMVDNTQIIFGLSLDPVLGDVMITEIMADPTGDTPDQGIPDVEYVELYNASDNFFILEGWDLKNDNTSNILPFHVLNADAYVIICDLNDVALLQPYGEVIGVPSFSSLTNGGDMLTLLSNNDVMSDAVTYDDSWYNVDPVPGGFSFELINPFHPCSFQSNWTISLSPEGGTPGAVNSVFDDSPDVTSPVIQSYDVNSDTELEVVFNEVITAEALLDISLTFDPPLEVLFVSVSDLSTINILFQDGIIENTLYDLNIQGLADCSGNVMVENTEIIFGITEEPELGDVLFNEIMADPTSDIPGQGVPDVEYIELYNASDNFFILKNWDVRNDNTSNILPFHILNPNAYVIVCDQEDVPLFQEYGDVIGVPSFSSLTNGGDMLTLWSNNGVLSDGVNYEESWYNVSPTPEGVSLERINPFLPCSFFTNWRASTAADGGTPGTQNSVFDDTPDVISPSLEEISVNTNSNVVLFISEVVTNEIVDNAVFSIEPFVEIESATFLYDNAIGLVFADGLSENTVYTLTIDGLTDCSGNLMLDNNQITFGLPEDAEAGDIVINEILFDPKTGGSDFIELYNTSDKIISLNSVCLSKFLDEQFIIAYYEMVELDKLIFPKSYIALTLDKLNIMQEYPLAVAENIHQVDFMLPYNNGEDDVILINQDNEILEQVFYTEDWHFELLDDTEGVSLERRRFEGESNNPNNWHSASAAVGFATPGYLNSQFTEVTDQSGEFELVTRVISPDNDGFQDVIDIQYKLEKPGFVANVKVVDDLGRLVSTLTRNEPLGIEGVISWDGVKDDGTRAPIGMYIILIEIFDLEGTVERYKEVITVATRL